MYPAGVTGLDVSQPREVQSGNSGMRCKRARSAPPRLPGTLTAEPLPQFPHLLLEVGGRGSSCSGKAAHVRDLQPERETLMKPRGCTGDQRPARARSGLEAEAGHVG